MFTTARSITTNYSYLFSDFFEGIAGSGADIDVVFKIEADVHTDDTLVPEPEPPRQPEGVPFPTTTHAMTPGPRTAVAPTPIRFQPIHEGNLRNRRTSFNAPLVAASSPLAQVFGPIIDPSPPGPEMAGLSYGPVGRRISTTRHRRNFTDPQSQLQSFRARVNSALASEGRHPLTHAPEPETVQEIDDDDEQSHVPSSEVGRQLRQIEERQMRMEAQLEDLVSLLRLS